VSSDAESDTATQAAADEATIAPPNAPPNTPPNAATDAAAHAVTRQVSQSAGRIPHWAHIVQRAAHRAAHRRLNLSGQPRRRAHLLRLAQRHQLHWHEVLLFTATGLTILCLLTPIVLFN
jgi:hypothetical protein